MTSSNFRAFSNDFQKQLEGHLHLASCSHCSILTETLWPAKPAGKMIRAWLQYSSESFDELKNLTNSDPSKYYRFTKYYILTADKDLQNIQDLKILQNVQRIQKCKKVQNFT